MNKNKPNTQWGILAGLRFFLAWIVFCNHIIEMFPDAGNLLIFQQCAKLNSFSAVIGFLVISGFSIAHSIEYKQKGFYQRRLLRIYPLYLSATVFSLLPFLLSFSELKVEKNLFNEPSIYTILGNVFFLQSFIVRPIDSNPVFWTLGVEVFCYLLAPIFRKMSDKILIYIIGFSSFLFCLYSFKPLLDEFIQKPYLGRPNFSSLMYGQSFLLILWAWLLGFLYFRLHDNKLYQASLVIIGCALFIIYRVDDSYYAEITYILTTSLMIFSSKIQLSKRVLKVFNYLGDISYPLYLFHYPAFILCYTVLGIKNIIHITLLAILIPLLSYHLIDIPIRLKGK